MENGLKPKMRFAWLGSLSSTSVECFCYLYRSTISLFSFSLLCKKCDCFFHQLILHAWLQTSGIKALRDALKADAKSYRRKVNLNLRDVKEEESSNCNQFFYLKKSRYLHPKTNFNFSHRQGINRSCRFNKQNGL